MAKRFSTRVAAILLILTVILLVPVVACTTEPATPTEPTTPTTPTTPETPEVIELIVNDHNPPFAPPAQANQWWADEVTRLSNGRLKLTVQGGGALLTGEEVYRGIQTGVADCGHYVVDSREGFALNLVMALPFMGWPEQHVEDKYFELLNEFPEMQQEWEDVTIIGCMMMPPTHLHNDQKVVKTPADMKGMKIMGAEYMLNATMQEAGATAVQLDIADMAPSINSGLIQGVLNHFPVVGVFGALELLPYHTIFGGGGVNITPMYMIMNTEKLNSLPPDLKELIIDSGDMWLQKQTELNNMDLEQSLGFCYDNNHTMTELTPQEIQVWYDLVKAPIHEKWIKDCEDKGLPGREVYEAALKLAKE